MPRGVRLLLLGEPALEADQRSASSICGGGTCPSAPLRRLQARPMERVLLWLKHDIYLVITMPAVCLLDNG